MGLPRAKKILDPWPKGQNKIKVRDQAIPLLGIYPREMKAFVQTKTQMFTAVWFRIAKKWGQGKCPLSNEWISQMWSIHTVKYYSAIERCGAHTIWTNFETVVLSKRRQSQKTTYRVIPFP